PRRRRQTWLATAKPCQATRAFPLDERLKCLADQAGLFLQAGESLGFGYQFVVQRERRSHLQVSIFGTILSSSDVDFNVAAEPLLWHPDAGSGMKDDQACSG